MKSHRTQTFLNLIACLFLAAGMSATAMASCGDSLSAMAASAASAQIMAHPVQHDSQSATATGRDASIVGLWHIQFTVGDQTIQEAFQLWNEGGTEVHNPNVDPRTGNVCLGVWKRSQNGAFKLAHRVWSYDSNGTFLGTINLRETVTVANDGKTHGGTFVLDFFDPSGNFLMEVPGNVSAERIAVD